MAFIMPQEIDRKADFWTHAVSIDQVEDKSGLDVLWALDDEPEMALEMKVAEGAWRRAFWECIAISFCQ